MYIYRASSRPAINTTRELLEDLHRERACDCHVARDVRVQEVARVELRAELARRVRVPHDRVEVCDGVEPPSVADECVHALARRLAHWARVRLDRRIEPRSAERGDRRREDREARGTCAQDELLVRGDDLVPNRLLRGVRCVRSANVVHTLEDERELDAWLREDVTVEAAERVWPEPIREDAVPARGLVREREGRERGITG